MSTRITADQARRLVLALQGLAEPPRRRLSADGLLELIERLGFVQVDSVSVVARAHHMILFARNQTYRPKLLQRLLESEARLFENWTHDAAIIPTRFYPYWQVRFAREKARLAARYRRRFGEAHEERTGQVLAHIRQNGAVMARDFNDADRTRARAGFWDWHPDKAALEFLWRTGDLTIARRQGFQKVYDLTERVIPAEARVEPSPEAFVDWACRGALQRLGFATAGEIAGFWDLLTLTEVKQWCAAHPDRARPVLIETVDGSARKVYARPDILDLVRAPPDLPRRMRVLSPFDPLLRDRKRLRQLFGFDYRIEIFVPADQRLYGYYVFPLLEGERLVGRIDMRAAGLQGLLEVTSLWLEPGRRLSRGRLDRLEAELDRIRRFVGATAIRFADGHVKRG